VIILCEDDNDQRLALRLALEQAKYSVREASNGREALALQRERQSPFLITDIFMPEIDGFELVDAVKKEFPATKVIVISAGGSKRNVDYLASARLIGVDETLEKPFKVDRLLKALKDLSH
jgi:two-component system, response regulator, stage 0 sporulation protein F